jgi:small subunit ribosomal protein S20
MPNLASAKKRLRQNVKKQLRNQIAKTRIKTEIKKSLETGDINGASGAIDRAASKGIIHRNAANRKKSRLAKRLATAASAQ